jgi:hypothetical protein
MCVGLRVRDTTLNFVLVLFIFFSPMLRYYYFVYFGTGQQCSLVESNVDLFPQSPHPPVVFVKMEAIYLSEIFVCACHIALRYIPVTLQSNHSPPRHPPFNIFYSANAHANRYLCNCVYTLRHGLLERVQFSLVSSSWYTPGDAHSPAGVVRRLDRAP